MSISVRVFDSTTGRPVPDLAISLCAQEHGVWPCVARARTDGEGRAGWSGPRRLPRGVYRLVFATAEYFREQGTEALHTEVILSVRYAGDSSDLHIPLFLSACSYSTHSGSPTITAGAAAHRN
ncbi:hydroxyisourate hydrolase [Streptomyces sp. NPDC059534]|uniref:hydroxyisourate hydrolase n=1 Tax=Streptomyces sp. NPDC059534 TaxID=3346859 RepID=UPI00368752DC